MSTGQFLVQKASDVAAATVDKAKLVPKRPSFLIAMFLVVWQILTDPTMLALLPHNKYTNGVKFAGLAIIAFRQLRTRQPDISKNG